MGWNGYGDLRKREGFVVVEVVVNDSIVVEALDGDDLLTRRRPCT